MQSLKKDKKKEGEMDRGSTRKKAETKQGMTESVGEGKCQREKEKTNG